MTKHPSRHVWISMHGRLSSTLWIRMMVCYEEDKTQSQVLNRTQGEIIMLLMSGLTLVPGTTNYAHTVLPGFLYESADMRSCITASFEKPRNSRLVVPMPSLSRERRHVASSHWIPGTVRASFEHLTSSLLRNTDEPGAAPIDDEEAVQGIPKISPGQPTLTHQENSQHRQPPDPSSPDWPSSSRPSPLSSHPDH